MSSRFFTTKVLTFHSPFKVKSIAAVFCSTEFLGDHQLLVGCREESRGHEVVVPAGLHHEAVPRNVRAQQGQRGALRDLLPK